MKYIQRLMIKAKKGFINERLQLTDGPGGPGLPSFPDTPDSPLIPPTPSLPAEPGRPTAPYTVSFTNVIRA